MVTLIVRGIKAADVQARTTPLPYELSGVTVLMEEPLKGFQAQLPILGIDSIICGSGFIYVCDTKGITVQIPIDLSLGEPPGPANPDGPVLPPFPVITISENGVAGFRTEFELRSNRIHIVNGCDLFVRSDRTCPALVTHADGSVITTTNPAKRGEELVIYAVGLGVTSPRIPAGQISPSPSPVAVATVLVRFSGQLSPSSELLPLIPDESWSRPSFVGLVPGLVGLYQVNIRVPVELPVGTPVPIIGNLTTIALTLASQSSSDTVQISIEQ